MKFHFVDQGPVVRRVDNFIQQINPYPVDKICSLSNQNQERANFIRWIKLYPLFVQPGPGVSILKLDYANYAKRKHLHQQKVRQYAPEDFNVPRVQSLLVQQNLQCNLCYSFSGISISIHISLEHTLQILVPASSWLTSSSRSANCFFSSSIFRACSNRSSSFSITSRCSTQISSACSWTFSFNCFVT